MKADSPWLFTCLLLPWRQGAATGKSAQSFFLQMPMMLTTAISDIDLYNVSNYATAYLHIITPLTK